MLWRFDSTQSTASERIKLYINGTQETNLNDTDYPSLNHDSLWNHTNKHLIGARTDNSTPTPIQEFDGYLAEFNLVDGQALAPDSFGEQKMGLGFQKIYTSISYGTNGFRLTFADSSSLGDDTSGNTNDFTSSGLASTDVVLDSPTNNFCTLLPLNANDNRGQATFSRGNLRMVSSSSNRGFTTGTMKLHGKIYFEVLSRDGNNGFVGINDINNEVHSGKGQSIDFYGGSPRIDGTVLSNTGTFDDGDIVGVAVDVDAKSIQFFKIILVFTLEIILQMQNIFRICMIHLVAEQWTQ